MDTGGRLPFWDRPPDASALVQLRAHGLHTQTRGPVGATVLRFDEPPLFQTQEHVEGAILEDVPLAGVAGDVAYLAVCVPFVVDGPTQGKHVQNTLFVF